MAKFLSTLAIEEELWRKFKAKAALEGRDMRQILEELIRLYVEGDEK